ncbi:glycosyltransferase [[Mycobacterium] burgundiense]|uniref:Glycosyltransferase n=1 Tax=[Mycobacterium] burgundiense TaxID=3064286 RepID=A0ABM9M6S0_9MYCO|nr:glycosyltransferase [Mycolicibacterium sp. MU0053]CAJ1510880.1 glycosyltransferase [Mycolicibacterium sp. MU0053]
MKFALACYGTRGDVEPSVSIGRELQRRGHDVRLAVPPDLVEFAEAAGLVAVPYGPELPRFLQEEFLRNFWTQLLRNPLGSLRELWRPIVEYWGETSTTLASLAAGADLLSTGLNYEQPAANVAEHYDIPLATLHHFPMRPNGRLVPMLPSVLVRSAGTISEWMLWRMTKEVEDAQRLELGLPKATAPSPRRIAARESLEIQAYDAVSVPGLAAEWSTWGDRRPFVGALTMGLATETDAEVTSWIADGTPPICFATGSIPVASPAETVEMISAACAQLGERALVCGGGTDFSGVGHSAHVKVVGTVNYATVFPACRAIVHHGGSGTTAASLRAGVPTLILWSSADQPYWGNQLKRLKVGASRRLSSTSEKSLTADLRRILTPEHASRARAVATMMTEPSQSVTKAADLFEGAVRRRAR